MQELSKFYYKLITESNKVLYLIVITLNSAVYNDDDGKIRT